MFEEKIAAMNQRTEETMTANAVQFDKRTYTVDEIQDILGISRTSAYNLVKKMNPKKVMINFIIELEDLKGREIFPEDTQIDSLLFLDGE